MARVNVLHHLSQGIDAMLILDHGSSDGTFEILEELSRRYGIACRRELSSFRQDRILTRLAAEARDSGADWIIPIDADEFWHAPGSSIREVLERSTAGALSVGVRNFVQHRAQQHPMSEGLLTMTRSVINTEPGAQAEESIEKGELPFLSYQYPRKHILRASLDNEISWGNHSAPVSAAVEACDAIEVFHAPLRSVDCISRKAMLDRSEPEIAEYLRVAWHVRHWRRQIQVGRLNDEWERNSYDDIGSEVFAKDESLRDLLAPWLGQGILPLRQITAELDPPPARVWGISVIRNEADILKTTVEHHLSLGCERILIIDNGSTDGTQAVLDGLVADDPRISWRSEPGVFAQDRLITDLAQQAFVEGATWVLPFDADEFWCARGRSLKEILSTDDVAIHVPVVNYLQRRSQLGPSLDLLSGLAMRPLRAIGPFDAAQRLVDENAVPYVLTQYSDKWMVRASPFLRIKRGNHEVEGLEGRAVRTDEIVCRHAPLRSRHILVDKREHGRRLNAQDLPEMIGWHVRRWAVMSDEELDQEWVLNSYPDKSESALSVEGLLVEDRLQDLVLAAEVASSPVHRRDVFRPLTTTDEAAILDCVSSVDGWLTSAEAIALARSAVECQQVPACHGTPLILEVGAYCGKSTVAMAAALRAAAVDGIIVSIDPHEGLVGAGDSAIGLSLEASTAQVFADNLRTFGLEQWVRPVRARSLEVLWNRRIEMLFLDSLHDEATVALDLERFEPWLAVGGMLAVHDYAGPFPGVQRAVDALRAGGRFSPAKIVDSMAILTKQSASGVHWPGQRS